MLAGTKPETSERKSTTWNTSHDCIHTHKHTHIYTHAHTHTRYLKHLAWSESDRHRPRGGGGIGRGPRRRSGRSSHPHSHLRMTGRHRGQWRDRNVRGVARGWLGGGGGDHRSAMDSKPQDAGPQIYQHFPSPSGADERSVDVTEGLARNGRVFHIARQGEAFYALSRRFATTSGFVNPLPVSRQHLYALYFLIRWAF